MSEIAFIFPGQGSQYVGMAQALLPYPEALEVYHGAKKYLGWDLLALCLEGPEEKLAEDLHAQLAVHVTNCAYAAVLRNLKWTPRLGSGFSLGIFSALVAAGSLSFEQGLEGVKVAAEMMSIEGKSHRGAMAAVIGLGEEEVQEICRKVPLAFLASMNHAKQAVISGEEGAVQRALDLCLQKGALLAKRLPIGWAIHTPLMEGATGSFAKVVAPWTVRPPEFPLLSYLRAEFLMDPEEIKGELSRQFSSPNRWSKVMTRIIGEGIKTFVEVGPGNVLSQMARWVDRGARIYPAQEILQRKGIAPE
jgi:[acyl-carrier-protein] S-malonyltransferase